MISTTAIAFVTLNIVGGCGLLLLLCTYHIVKTLPLRRNPFLINLIFISYLATIPSLMLLFTGQQGRITMQWTCVLQSALMDGVAPMFCSALVILVFQTCSELRAIVQLKTTSLSGSVGSWPASSASSVGLRRMLVLTPYIVFLVWFIASLASALRPSARVLLYPFVFCTNDASTGFIARYYAGYFAVVCVVTAIAFEIWTAIVVFACLRRCRVSENLTNTSTLFGANIYMLMRLVIFSSIQIAPIILTAINTWHAHKTGTHSSTPRDATQITESAYPLALFLLFGSQRAVLQAWKILPSTPQDEKLVSMHLISSESICDDSGSTSQSDEV